MKTKKKLIVLLVCLTILGITGFSYAAIITSTDTTKNVSTSNLDIELVQRTDNGTAITNNEGIVGFDYNAVVPGTVINESMAVKAGNSSKSAYVRVTVNRYWLKDGIKDVEGELDPKAIQLEIPNNEWIVMNDSSDDEIVYFYYRLPLKAGQTSSNLIDGFALLKNSFGNSNEYSGYSSHIDFFAEGVQILAGKDAILAEWGVEATIDDNNMITNLVEQ